METHSPAAARRVIPPPRQFTMSFSDPFEFIYVRTAKCATQSISAALKSRPEIEIRRNNRFRPYPTGKRRDYFAFAFVRNPFTRLVSTWRQKVIGGSTWALTALTGLPFDEFVRRLAELDLETTDRHVRPLSSLIPTERISFLGRMERLTPDWADLCGRLGIGDLTLPTVNETRGPSLEAELHIDESTADLIRQLYEKDFRLFGYSPDVPEKLRRG